jgi:hypothetical protein
MTEAKILTSFLRKPTEAERADLEAEQAMTWLRRAVAAGFRCKNGVARHKDFNVLRGRADSGKLMAELEAKPK